MMSVLARSVFRGRAGRPGGHLVNPHGEAVAADRSNCEGGHHHGGEEKEGEDFHPPAARTLAAVVSNDRHKFSLNLGRYNGAVTAKHNIGESYAAFDLNQPIKRAAIRLAW